MPQGSRPQRISDQIRAELGHLLTRTVRDPGIGFVTITRVHTSGDLQLARVYYTALGTANALKDTARALERARPFLKRQVGQRLRLKRVPELTFHFDEDVERQIRIEQLLAEARATDAAAADDVDDDPDT